MKNKIYVVWNTFSFDVIAVYKSLREAKKMCRMIKLSTYIEEIELELPTYLINKVD